MPQDFFQADGYQVEPGSGDTITIDRDSTAGAMRFIDAVLTGGALLSALVGIRNISDVYVVGNAGDGAPYTTITSALADITGASASAPAIILVFPGVYVENVTIEKDGVAIVGLGRVTIQPSTTTSPTVLIQAAGETPGMVILQNLRIEHATDGEVCIDIDGGAGSTVLESSGLFIKDCEIVASGNGTYQIDASTVGNIRVQGGSWEGSSSSSICQVANCTSFHIQDVAWTNEFQLAYDTANPRPNTTTCEYKAIGLGRTDLFNIDLDGEGSMLLANCPEVGTVTQGGDQTLAIRDCHIGALTINETTAVTRIGGSRGTASGAGTLEEAMFSGTIAFTASTSESENLQVTAPDANYAVYLDWESESRVLAVTSKSTTSFTVTAESAHTGTVYYSVVREISI